MAKCRCGEEVPDGYVSECGADQASDAAERRALLELYVELSSYDPEEHPKGNPVMVPLVTCEILALRKLIQRALVAPENDT